MMPRKKLKKSHDENACKLCLSQVDEEAIYGKLIKTEIGNVHYFCVLFACGLEQKGEEDEDVFGFLVEDIRKEILRANKLKCSFCRQNTVASACAIKECRVKYHFNCGLMNNVLFHYFDKFESYCIRHRPDRDKKYDNIDSESCCYICLEKFKNNENDENLNYQVLLTVCCSKFLHIRCVKHQAFNSGLHFFKCPLCNDRDKFINCAQEHGIYLPDRDAIWEQDQQVWREQEQRYSYCDAVCCKCPNGRSFCGEDYSDWEIITCYTCGSYGIHNSCNIEDDQNEIDFFECPECAKLTIKMSNSIQIIERESNNPELNENLSIDFGKSNEKINSNGQLINND